MQRPENEIVALGNYVESLFNEAHFISLCEEFEQRTVQDILGTEPHAQKEREGYYASVRGKREFISMMLAYVAGRDKIIEKSQRHEAPDEYED